MTKTPKTHRRDRTPPKVQAQLAALPEATPGRAYVLVAPHCWGKGTTAQSAEANARKHRARVYEPPQGWCWILFDAPAHAYIDEMGSICYNADDANLPDHDRPYREVLRFNMPKEGAR